MWKKDFNLVFQSWCFSFFRPWQFLLKTKMQRWEIFFSGRSVCEIVERKGFSEMPPFCSPKCSTDAKQLSTYTQYGLQARTRVGTLGQTTLVSVVYHQYHSTQLTNIKWLSQIFNGENWPTQCWEISICTGKAPRDHTHCWCHETGSAPYPQ